MTLSQPLLNTTKFLFYINLNRKLINDTPMNIPKLAQIEQKLTQFQIS